MTDAAFQPRKTPSLLRCCALFTAALLIAVVPAGAVAFNRHAVLGVLSVALAALLVGLAGNAAVVAAGWYRHTPQAVSGVLAGTVVGLFVPLVGGLVAESVSPALAEAGLMGWTVTFYLAALLIKTLLIVRLVGAPDASAMQREQLTDG